MDEKTDFAAFARAVRDADLPDGEANEVRGAQAVPLTHTSSVTPKDWERVQRSLAEPDGG